MGTKELLRRYYDEVWEKGNVEAIDELVAEDYVDHTPPPGGDASRESLRLIARYFAERAKETRLELRMLVADGDAGAGFWEMEWVHTGDFFGAPADGKRLTMKGADLFVVRDGRIAETWHTEAVLEVFGQLGMTPKP